MPNSAAPSQRRTHNRWWLRALAGVALIAALVTAYQMAWRQHVKRFQTVHSGALYRVAQPSAWGVRYLVYRHGVKTILNLRLEDDNLRCGPLGAAGPAGEVESKFVGTLGIAHRQWPMGNEAYWPWFTPWQFEEFFRLFDDPANLPVAVHCVSGRHRTGTFAALYRLEYDRWSVDRTLAEMYSFDFGQPIPLQEMNLRTYVPRPCPTDAEWRALREAATPACRQPSEDYAALVYALRSSDDPAAVRRWLTDYLKHDGTFALPLAARVIDTPDDEACTAATAAAERALAAAFPAEDSTSETTGIKSSKPTLADLNAAAALIADYGTPEQQQRLTAIMRAEIAQPDATVKYHALAAGIGNRYTGNRVPFLALLLDDARPMPGTGRDTARYRDMAVARLAGILDQRLIDAGPYPQPRDWDTASSNAKSWLAAHPQIARLSRLIEPTGHNVLK